MAARAIQYVEPRRAPPPRDADLLFQDALKLWGVLQRLAEPAPPSDLAPVASWAVAVRRSGLGCWTVERRDAALSRLLGWGVVRAPGGRIGCGEYRVMLAGETLPGGCSGRVWISGFDTVAAGKRAGGIVRRARGLGLIH